MMTRRDEIMKLSDADLVAAVAERVMGWCDLAVPGEADGEIVRWSPLTDWNHTMQVVEVMRAKFFAFPGGDCGDGYAVTFYRKPETDMKQYRVVLANVKDDTDRRRANLQAALIAMEDVK